MLSSDFDEFAVRPFTNVMGRFDLSDKKALVTGAAGGIGGACARAFAEMGADVALMDVVARQAELEQVAASIAERYKVRSIAITGDVADESSISQFIHTTVDALGTIDILHNNAGIASLDRADMAFEEWRRLMAINVDGVMLVGRAAANVMIEHGHGGSIINTASMSGHIVNRMPDANYGFAYTTSKAAVLHMTRAMAAEYVKYGIRVNSVSPGVVLSGIHDMVPPELLRDILKDVPLGRFGTLDEVAGVVAFLASDLSSFMIGSDVLADGGQCIT